MIKESSVFKSMFTAASADVSEKLFDCPVVAVYDDPKAMAELLKAIHVRKYSVPLNWRIATDDVSSYFGYHTRTKHHVKTVLDILELSEKYDVADIRADAIEILTWAFPNTLRAWDASYPARTQFPKSELVASIEDFNTLLTTAH